METGVTGSDAYQVPPMSGPVERPVEIAEENEIKMTEEEEEKWKVGVYAKNFTSGDTERAAELVRDQVAQMVLDQGVVARRMEGGIFH